MPWDPGELVSTGCVLAEKVGKHAEGCLWGSGKVHRILDVNDAKDF